jgi:hypothetical protein
MFRKPWNANKDGALDLIMSEWDDIAVDKANSPVIEDPEDMSEEELNSLDENLSTTEE